MPAFEDREREFENRFKHDEELRFKITARRNRLLGGWAAQRLGLAGGAAEDYARSVVEAVFAGGDKAVVAKVVGDLAAKGQGVTPEQVQFELDHFAVTARQQVMAE
jgi:hypothetical protein